MINIVIVISRRLIILVIRLRLIVILILIIIVISLRRSLGLGVGLTLRLKNLTFLLTHLKSIVKQLACTPKSSCFTKMSSKSLHQFWWNYRSVQFLAHGNWITSYFWSQLLLQKWYLTALHVTVSVPRVK